MGWRWWSSRCWRPLLLLPLLNRQWRAVLAAIVVPVAFNLAACPWSSTRWTSSPAPCPTRWASATTSTARSKATASTSGCLLADPVAANPVHPAGHWQLVAAVPLLPHPRPAVLVHHIVGRAAAVVVAGAVAGPGLLLDDAVPVPDDGGAAQFGDSQLAGVAGHLRIPDDGQAGCCSTGCTSGGRWST